MTSTDEGPTLPASPFGPFWWLAVALPRWRAWLALAITAVVTLLSVCIPLTDPYLNTLPQMLFSLAAYGLLPPTVGLLVAGVFDKEALHLPRALLFGASLLTLFVGWLGVLLAMAIEGNAWGAVVATCFLFVPLFVVSAPSALAYTVGSVGQIQMLRDTSRQAFVYRACRERRQRLQALSDVIDREPAVIESILEGFVESGMLDGRVEDGIWFPHVLVETLQQDLLRLVEDQGSVRLEDAAHTLGVTPTHIEHWVYEMVFSGRFQGDLNWNERRLIGGAAAKLGEQTECPACGGQLGLAAGGIARCKSCGTERFLEAA